MNYNPYAPPQAAPPPGGGPMVVSGAAQPWEIGEVLSAAFDAFKASWVPLVLSTVAMVIIVYVPIILFMLPILLHIVRISSFAGIALRGAGYLIALVTISFLQAGYLRMLLNVARGRQTAFGELFSGGDRFIPMLGAFFVVGVATGLGMVLFVVPGIILSLGLCCTSFLVVDRGMSPVEAAKASWAATSGLKMKLFVFGIVAFFIALGSEIACCLPVLAAIPVLQLAMTIVYLRITGGGGPAPMAAGGPPPGYGGPPAGYGGPPPGYGPPPGGQGYGPPPGGGGYGPQGGGYGPGGGRPQGY